MRRATYAALAFVFLASLLDPAQAGAVSIPSIPIPNPLDAFPGSLPNLDPTSLFVDGFKAIIQYILGDRLDELGKNLINLLLAVPLLTDHRLFPKLNDYRGYITGGCWGLLGLSFVVSSVRYLFSPGGSGVYDGLVGFFRTAGAIAIILVFPVAFDMISRIVNSFTVALIDTPIIGHSFTQTLSVPVAAGGIGMILGIAAVIIALFLLVIKVIITSLLAVLFLLSPIAIALWPIEELSWALGSLLQAMGALLVFPIIWAVCFGAFAILPVDALFPGNQGDYINTLMVPLMTVALFVIMMRLPFAVLSKAGSAGMSPGLTRGMRHVNNARSMVPSRGRGGNVSSPAPSVASSPVSGMRLGQVHTRQWRR